MRFHKNFLGETFYYESVMSNSFFEVHLCGDTPPNADYEMFRYDNFVYVFEYVVSGKGYINSGNRCYAVAAGDFYFLKKGFTGHYFADKDEPYSKIWVNVRGSLVDQAVKIYGMTSDIIINHCNDSRIQKEILAIHKILINVTPENRAELVRLCSIKILNIMSIAQSGKTIENGVIIESGAVKIYQYIEMHLYDNISLSSIAEYTHMHETTVIRVFKEKYGTTPMKYLNALRINAAKRMIRDNISVKSIASMLSYSDISYFSLSFKKATGMSPSQYHKYIRLQTNIL